MPPPRNEQLAKAFTLAEVFLPHCTDCRKNAFTLAEVLVTLGIIGVVSAMTLPTLVKNHQRQVYVTQLHKVVNELSQAAELYITDRNSIGLKETPLYNSDVGLRNFIKNYFKVVKDCGTSTNGCFADKYKSIDGSKTVTYNTITCNIVFTLASGASICADTHDDNKRIIGIEVDINGKQGPNIFGRDFFYLSIDNNGTVFDEYEYDEKTFTVSSPWSPYFAKILNDGWKMEY